MRLVEALRLGPDSMVTFVGAGGKTSLLRRLVEERREGEKVVVTCTTRLAYSERDLAAQHLEIDGTAALRRLADLLEQHGSLLITGAADREEGKVAGLPPEWVDRAHDLIRSSGAILAVEGDGARGRWVKGPEEHEPVIPKGTRVCAPVFNLKALGRPLDQAVAHRPERVAELIGAEVGDVLTAEHCVRLLTHPAGGLKGCPQGAEARAVLTAAAASEATAAAVDGLVASESIRAVVHVPEAAAGTCLTCSGRIGAVVLAAGESSRMGRLKQVMPWRGRPMIQHVTAAARTAGLEPVVVVTGAQAEKVERAVETESVRVVHNPDWQRGQSASLKAGMQAIADQVEAVVFFLADMPLVDSELVSDLVDKHRRTLAPIIAPRAGGRWGNPVLFDRATFADLRTIRGDRGGRALYERYEVVGVPAGEGALLDLDAPEDLERLGGDRGRGSVR